MLKLKILNVSPLIACFLWFDVTGFECEEFSIEFITTVHQFLSRMSLYCIAIDCEQYCAVPKGISFHCLPLKNPALLRQVRFHESITYIGVCVLTMA